MNDILKTYMERFRENRHTLRRYTAFVLALAMITTLFVNWQLHGVGISMTAQYQCGEEEHAHTADCYTKVLTCGYEEGELENADEVAAAATSQPTVEEEPAPLALEPQIEFVPHEHTDDCYTEVQTLTCMEEEHVHDDDCFDPEDGNRLICDKFEHTHDESCYTTEYELTCGLEEGELVEQVVEPTQSAELAAMAAAKPVALEPVVDTVEPIYHHHTDACYEEVLTCLLPEHQHTVACLSDTSADLETPEEWQAANAKAVISGNWAEDLVSVAKTQLGYEQSEKNFEIDPADGVTLRYYSRYGQSYGNPYGEWDVMFLSYCLKYAGIPQSAIPQEASVLALRSSMSDMEWLLDGEDGSSADVGDIVIYNKYVTRTVAVDSSADGAADGLDDQFSMDAEGENGAELEESGAAALDSTPATEDMTTLDTPDLPDIPDTAAPSVGSPAAEPQTTTVTDAQPVETVGIVSEVDENTLTVISGDVDGKVAEVTLSNAEVLGVVSVAYAQYADEMLSSAVDGALWAPMMLAAAGEPMTVSTATKLDESWITGTTITLNGTTYKVKGNSSDPELPNNVSVTVNDNVKLSYDFMIPDTAVTNHPDTLTYQLPSHLIALENGTDGPLYNASGHKIGKIVVDDNGLATLTFDAPLTGQTSGKFTVSCRVSETSSSTDTAIKFPGDNHTIEIKNQTNIRIDKTTVKNNGLEITRLDDGSGSYKVTYKVTVTSDYGSGDPIELKDAISWISDSSMFTDIKYTNIQLRKNSVDYTDWKCVTYNENNGYPAIKITTQKGELLPALGKGEKYTLQYDLVFKKNKQGWGQINNTAIANGKPDGEDVRFENEVYKYGTHDPKTNTIAWTIFIYPNGNKLTGFTLTDTLPEGTAIKGDIIIKNYNSQEKDRITGLDGYTSFTYTFPNNPPFNESNPEGGLGYTVTYTTTVPDNFETLGKVTNTATITLPDNTKWEYKGDASYDKGHKEVTKQALNNSTLSSSQMDSNGVFTLPWSLEVKLPRNDWNSSGEIEIQDTISKPENGTHYAIKSELEQDIQKNLEITVDGKNYQYNPLPEGLTLTIEYYELEDWHNKYTSPQDDAIVRSFKLNFKKSASFKGSLDKVVISEYSTKATYDSTKLSAGQTIEFKNTGEGHSASYKFTVPANDTKALVKTSANKPGDNYHSNATPPYKASGVAVEYGNGYKDFDGNEYKGTYVYYQLELTPGKLDENWTGATVTDTLSDYLSYVDGSAYVVVRYGSNDMYAGNPYREYSPEAQWKKADGSFVNKTTRNLSNPDFFSVEPNGKTLTFELTSKFKDLNDYPSAQYIDRIMIRFAAKVDDNLLDLTKESDVQIVSNAASWGNMNSTTKTEVRYDSNLVEKTGQYSSENYRAEYSVIINPDALKLGDSDTITLEDVMSTGAWYNTAELDRASVKLYDYDTVNKTKGAEIDRKVYSVSYQEPDATKYECEYRLTVGVPNSHAYVLEYAYRNTCGNSYSMNNEATLHGKTSKVYNIQMQVATAQGEAHSAGLTLHKVDSRNITTPLEGAEFKLQWFDPSDGKYKDVQTATTNENGDINLTFSAGSTGVTPGLNAAGNIIRPYNYLYKLTETKAPAGYRKDDSWAFYFIWTSEASQKDAAYRAAVSGNESSIVVDPNNINYYFGSAAVYLQLTNESNRLTLVKQWYDKDNNLLPADKQPNSVDVELRRSENKLAANTPVDDTNTEFVESIRLTKIGNWTYDYEIPDGFADYYYYVKEVQSGASYKVSYTGNDGVQYGGTIVITNTETENADYELPSTGGTGTLPYTAVGGTMMLTALAYNFIHRKRRHEGRADD